MDPIQVPLPRDEPEQIPLHVMQTSFHNLQMEMRAQSMSKQIRDFSGEGSRRFREWLKDIERVGAALGADDERLKILALQSMKGIAGDYFARLLKIEPQPNWAALKRALSANFSEESDALIANQKLHTMKQSKGEAIQTFIERIRTIAEEAYIGHDLRQPLVQRQLVDTLVGGISDKMTAKRIMRERPETFDRAVNIAVSEHQTMRAFNLRRGEEDMEVDVVSAKRGLEDKLEGFIDKMEALMIKSKFEGRDIKGDNPQKKTHKWTQDGKPICSFCGKIGHVLRKCYKRQGVPSRQSPSN